MLYTNLNLILLSNFDFIDLELDLAAQVSHSVRIIIHKQKAH